LSSIGQNFRSEVRRLTPTYWFLFQELVVSLHGLYCTWNSHEPCNCYGPILHRLIAVELRIIGQFIARNRSRLVHAISLVTPILLQSLRFGCLYRTTLRSSFPRLFATSSRGRGLLARELKGIIRTWSTVGHLAARRSRRKFVISCIRLIVCISSSHVRDLLTLPRALFYSRCRFCLQENVSFSVVEQTVLQVLSVLDVLALPLSVLWSIKAPIVQSRKQVPVSFSIAYVGYEVVVMHWLLLSALTIAVAKSGIVTQWREFFLCVMIGLIIETAKLQSIYMVSTFYVSPLCL
jgi:hypothetical protein